MTETAIKPVLCIWHKGCSDGFGAAWCLVKALGRENVELFGGVYQQAAPTDDQLKDREVYLVDFSYDEATLRHMASLAKTVTILDHHKTAKAAVQPLLDEGVVQGRFADDVSGALLTWQWFFPEQDAPALIKHISDRDLWEFKLPYTREIVGAVYSHGMDLDTWDALMEADLEKLIVEGTAIERDHKHKVASFVESVRGRTIIAGYDVPVANVPYAWASDAGHIMDADEPFSATFYLDTQGLHFSLRSERGKGVDVGEIARLFGGGGHENAAGFSVNSWDALKGIEKKPTE